MKKSALQQFFYKNLSEIPPGSQQGFLDTAQRYAIINKDQREKMAEIFVCGDTHGGTDSLKIRSNSWPCSRFLTKEDFLIITGDAGILWSPDDFTFLKWLDRQPYTTLWIDGNHENFTMLKDRSIAEKRDHINGKVFSFSKTASISRIRNSGVYHLGRGDIFIFKDSGKAIFVMGGGNSIDKDYRIRGLSWWPEELPDNEEKEFALKNLSEFYSCKENKLSAVITHTCPYSFLASDKFYKAVNKNMYFSKIYYDQKINNSQERRFNLFLDKILNEYIKQKKIRWYFGHFHFDSSMDLKTDPEKGQEKIVEAFALYNNNPLKI